MSHWKVVLNTGEIVEEGVKPWVEILGESLPWRRLCEYLEKEGKWIDTLFIVTPENSINITELGDNAPDFYSIQNDLVVNNIMGGADISNTLHVASHHDDGVTIHTFFNDKGFINSRVDKESYKPLVPSPRRQNAENV